MAFLAKTAMNVLGILENGLFALSQVLRLPVIILLWVCVAAALFMAGGCVTEYLARRAENDSGFNLLNCLARGRTGARRQRSPTGGSSRAAPVGW